MRCIAKWTKSFLIGMAWVSVSQFLMENWSSIAGLMFIQNLLATVSMNHRRLQLSKTHFPKLSGAGASFQPVPLSELACISNDLTAKRWQNSCPEPAFFAVEMWIRPDWIQHWVRVHWKNQVCWVHQNGHAVELFSKQLVQTFFCVQLHAC